MGRKIEKTDSGAPEEFASCALSGFVSQILQFCGVSGIKTKKPTIRSMSRNFEKVVIALQ
ncbi:hypothetical protein [Rhizobium aouanii]|uniref:Uncharacterized protein n=1 Tax=Rhizobium aouanii TaxID=3118145 RepID=A0ABU8CPN0_9HYPH